MKDCGKYAENLTLLAAGCLDGEELAALELHVAGCAECRAELQALTVTCGVLDGVARLPAETELRAGLGARLAEAMRSERREIRVVQLPQRFPWGLIRTAACLAVVVLAAMAIQSDQRVPGERVERDDRAMVAPTLMNLQRAMKRSNEALFEMLDQQAERLQLGGGESALAAGSFNSFGFISRKHGHDDF